MIFVQHAEHMCKHLVDSTVLTTRIYWRVTYYGATDAEARDPRPWSDVLAERAAGKDNRP